MTTSENKQEPRCTQTFQKSQQLGDDTSTKSSYCAQLEENVFSQWRAVQTLTCLPSVTEYINKKSVRAKRSQWVGGGVWGELRNLQWTNFVFIHVVLFFKGPVLCKIRLAKDEQ